MTQSREQEPKSILSIFPKGVTPEIRAQIDSYVTSGKPLEVSIAKFVHEERERIKESLMEILALPPLPPEQEADKRAVDERFREGRNILFNIVNTAFFYSFASTHLLAACGELHSRSTNPEEGGVADLMLQSLERDLAIEMELTRDEVEQKKASYTVEGFISEGMFENEFKKRSPLEFIDFCTEVEEKQIDKFFKDLQNPMLYIFLRMASQQGRSRFHELYEDMQKGLTQHN